MSAVMASGAKLGLGMVLCGLLGMVGSIHQEPPERDREGLPCPDPTVPCDDGPGRRLPEEPPTQAVGGESVSWWVMETAPGSRGEGVGHEA